MLHAFSRLTQINEPACSVSDKSAREQITANTCRPALSMATATLNVQGHVNSGFEPVREAFSDNFSQRRELGGACCGYPAAEPPQAHA